MAHCRLSNSILGLGRPWIVTYDKAAIKTGLYPAQRRMVYGLSYSAQDRYSGREVMFLSDDLKLPRDWSQRRFPLTRPDSRHPVYGRMQNMKPPAEIEEGPAAFERFRRAVKTIISVPKPAVAQPETARTKKKRAVRKG